jgi:hypothetical protein
MSQAPLTPVRKRVGCDELLTEEDTDETEIILTEEDDDIEGEDR